MLGKLTVSKKRYSALLKITLGICCPILIAMIWLKILDVEMAPFTRDITQYAQLPFYTGIISNLGILLWGVTAAICFFTAIIVKKMAASRQLFNFFLASGALTTWFLLDDGLTLHEIVLPILLHLPQRLIYAAYLGIAGIYLWKFRRKILETNRLNLVLAILFLGLSISIDSVLTKNEFIFEDGFKLLGIINWHLYLSNACFQEITGSLAAKMLRAKVPIPQ